MDHGADHCRHRQPTGLEPSSSRKPEHRTEIISETAKLEPWQWPEEHWRGLVNHVRAGRSFRPKAWKDGARCAVVISNQCDASIDNDLAPIFRAVSDLAVKFAAGKELFAEGNVIVHFASKHLSHRLSQGFGRAPSINTLCSFVPNRDAGAGKIANNNRIVRAIQRAARTRSKCPCEKTAVAPPDPGVGVTFVGSALEGEPGVTFLDSGERLSGFEHSF